MGDAASFCTQDHATGSSQTWPLPWRDCVPWSLERPGPRYAWVLDLPSTSFLRGVAAWRPGLVPVSRFAMKRSSFSINRSGQAGKGKHDETHGSL